MMKLPISRRELASVAAVLVSAALAASSVHAEEACGLCDKDVVINSDLATCFLGEYQNLVSKDGAAIVVDLSECEASRGVVEALAAPKIGVEEPSLKFMLSKAQLACLKTKLEEPGLVLDPSAKIPLDSCG
jgi:hypothetical protein